MAINDRIKIIKARLLHSPQWSLLQQFAALSPEEQTELARSLSALPDEIQTALAELGPISPGEHDRKLINAYCELTPKEGHELATDLIGQWSSGSDMGLEDLSEPLSYLAGLVPGSLKGVHGPLVEEFYLFPFEIFVEADANTRDRLIQLVETEHDTTALRFLAWIDDDVVRSTFHRWLQAPPAWMHDAGPLLRAEAKDAGWELTLAGERRLLYHPECYALLPVEEPAAQALPGPVSVFLPHDEHCDVCDGSLTTLFDIDLDDPRMSSVAPGWNRLRIATCERCIGYREIVTLVDGSGGSHAPEGGVKWHSAPDGGWDLPRRTLALGSRRHSPYEAQLIAEGVSQIGGFPKWEGQEPHPDCPECQRAMIHVGQVAIAELYEGGYDGVIYAFLCQDCGNAATTYAQT